MTEVYHTLRGFGTERARLGTFRGLCTERARLGTFRGFGTERARLGTFNQNFLHFPTFSKKSQKFVVFLLKKSTYLRKFSGLPTFKIIPKFYLPRPRNV